MKGVILAGGTGSRLGHLTKAMNKHMLPVGKYPMIYYPIMTMIDNGITDILIVTGDHCAGQFVDLLGDGTQLGCNLLYSYQSSPLGIADALQRAENFVGIDDQFLVILGDNIYLEPLDLKPNNNYLSKIFLKSVPSPQHYGVASFNENDEVTHIEEKPQHPPSNYVATGAYIYPSSVFGHIQELSPSARGELEITHINNMYLSDGLTDIQYLVEDWYDCGESIPEYIRISHKLRDVDLAITSDDF